MKTRVLGNEYGPSVISAISAKSGFGTGAKGLVPEVPYTFRYGTGTKAHPLTP